MHVGSKAVVAPAQLRHLPVHYTVNGAHLQRLPRDSRIRGISYPNTSDKEFMTTVLGRGGRGHLAGSQTPVEGFVRR